MGDLSVFGVAVGSLVAMIGLLLAIVWPDIQENRRRVALVRARLARIESETNLSRAFLTPAPVELRERIELRCGLVEDAADILARAERERRTLTARESQQFDRIRARVDALDGRQA